MEPQKPPQQQQSPSPPQETQPPQKAPLRPLSDEEIRFATTAIDKLIAPVLKQVVELLNRALAPKGIHAGLDINWFFGRAPSPESQNEEGKVS